MKYIHLYLAETTRQADHLMNRFRQVQPVMAFAAARLDRDVSLRALADVAGASPFHLHRVFSKVACETPKQFTLRIRMDRAAAALLTGQDSVLQIALGSGFESHEGFTRAFRRRFRMTPSAYRARGFAGDTSEAQAATHKRLVFEVGPCVGLYRIHPEQSHRKETMSYSITTKDASPQAVLLERRRVSQSEIAATIGEVVGQVFGFAQQEGLALTGNPFTRYVDVGPGLMTIEPGIRVADPGDAWPSCDDSGDHDPEPGVVRKDTLPGGRIATTVHAGPYDTLGEAYAALETWIASKGLSPAGAPWESYLTDPTEHPDPADWRTEISWPVQ